MFWEKVVKIDFFQPILIKNAEKRFLFHSKLDAIILKKGYFPSKNGLPASLISLISYHSDGNQGWFFLSSTILDNPEKVMFQAI